MKLSHRLKIGAGVKRSWKDPRRKKLTSDKLKRAWARPGAKVRRANILKRYWAKGRRKDRLGKSLKAAWNRPGERKRRAKRWHVHEIHACNALRRQGHRVITKGWPDAISIKGKVVKFIEFKGPGQLLKRHQVEMHRILKKFGIIVEVTECKSL